MWVSISWNDCKINEAPDVINIPPVLKVGHIQDNQALADSPILSESNEIKHQVPTFDTTFKAYMDYHKITDKTSKQWALQEQAYTDSNGLRKIGNSFCVAMGTFYADECGKKFNITLDSGKNFNVIVADIKDNRHTNKSNMYTPLMDETGMYIYNSAGVQMVNMLEFIVDTDVLSGSVRDVHGSVSMLGFEGNITEIVEVNDDSKI